MTAEPDAPSSWLTIGVGRRPLPARAWARRPHVAPPPPTRPPGRAPRQLHQGVAVTCRMPSAHLPAPAGGAQVEVDGHELLRGRWGRIEVPLPAGQHRVVLYLPRGRQRLQLAGCAIDVPRHRLVELEYVLSGRWFGVARLSGLDTPLA
ncbi:hypothetical protein GIY30_08210 [Gordonia sp. HNM0687]|uniref:Uncharacterized protein n=1 Tax=Gordonia mangrovi TaxID=2665643 RepID=A0A6L7GN24_9ACTN|nr:hypothetical protein [Gordonia mangrovi]MXP21334.1 hypothetical protein [Gordonia mangrovi]UVF80084.1 hypothetical protein NWF22_09785 [Gordonia mangrovi]